MADQRGPLEVPRQSAVIKTIHCSPQTNSKVPLLMTTPAQLCEHGDMKLVPLHPCVLASLVWECTLNTIKRET